MGIDFRGDLLEAVLLSGEDEDIGFLGGGCVVGDFDLRIFLFE